METTEKTDWLMFVDGQLIGLTNDRENHERKVNHIDVTYVPIKNAIAAPELLESLQWLVKQIPELKGEISLIGLGKCYEAIKKATES